MDIRLDSEEQNRNETKRKENNMIEMDDTIQISRSFRICHIPLDGEIQSGNELKRCHKIGNVIENYEIK